VADTAATDAVVLTHAAIERIIWRGISPKTVHAHPALPDPSTETIRAHGDALCACGAPYRNHPYDYDVLSWLAEPFLHVLCDGLRVKL
jgi:hypothetical protein